MKRSNILIIGIGNHAKRIYVPLMHSYSKHLPINLVMGIELKGREKDIESYLHKKNIPLEMTYLDRYDAQKDMPKDIENTLNDIVKEKNIEGVIISTDPLAHKVYAKWALSQGLNILMDKPVSTRDNASVDLRQALGIEEDYKELREMYDTLQKKKDTIFTVNVQRRYEIGYQKVFELIKEVSDKFNVPVTSIQAMHSDGVWIFPDEIISQSCHPYNRGFGKCSHSGYHLFDIVWQLYMAGKIDEKFPDKGEAMTSFLLPDGLLTDINQDDYVDYFGSDYEKLKKIKDVDLPSLYQDYGEIDAFSLIRLLKDNRNICNISINLLHNSFSRRSWMLPNEDLYKGNGRVKHQSYYIQQGPFQTIQIHNYQANDKQDRNTVDDYKLGGNNHFDIYVFRNSRMFGEDEKPLQVYNLKDLDTENIMDDSKLYHEIAKGPVIQEFIQFLTGNIANEQLKSNITSHEVPVKIMSSIYASHVQQRNGNNPLVGFSIK